APISPTGDAEFPGSLQYPGGLCPAALPDPGRRLIRVDGIEVPALIAFAGIWECWRDREGGEIDTVAILTCAANATVTPLRNRMPLLSADAFEAWLDCVGTDVEAALGLLQPAPDDVLEAIGIDPKINDSRRDEPGIQEPLQPSLL
ncbi:MAG: SOS response-associated peptidase family protein, partial [Methyloceanibacter sp.]